MPPVRSVGPRSPGVCLSASCRHQFLVAAAAAPALRPMAAEVVSVVFLGGDQFWTVLLSARLGYRHITYAEWVARWPRWNDRVAAMSEAGAPAIAGAFPIPLSRGRRSDGGSLQLRPGGGSAAGGMDRSAAGVQARQAQRGDALSAGHRRPPGPAAAGMPFPAADRPDHQRSGTAAVCGSDQSHRPPLRRPLWRSRPSRACW